MVALSPLIGLYAGLCGLSQIRPSSRLSRFTVALAVDHPGHDIAVFGDRPAAHGDPVAVADGRLDHAVAAHGDGEQLALADQLAWKPCGNGGETVAVFGVLDGGFGGAGGVGGDADEAWVGAEDLNLASPDGGGGHCGSTST
jgi:hypothetical protein